jgi:hypothetical protein
MSQPNHQLRRKLRSHSFPANDVHKLLNALIAFDRTLVEFSMDLYKVPRRDRAALRKLHRRLHDSVRERLPGLLHQPHRVVQA